MQAIESEAIAEHHTLRLPAQVPDGIRLRVLVLMEAERADDAPAEPAIRTRRKPSPVLASSVVMHDDLLQPAAPENDWDALR